jgi:inositol phosphorylceramide synthase catalytic subunit
VIQQLWRHMRSLWPRWTLLPVLPYLAYGVAMIVIGDLRWDHAAMMILVPVLAYGNERTKKLYMGAHPIALVALLYDGMRYMKNLGVSPDRVHDCDLRAIELSLFGVGSGADRMTLNDFFLTHHWTAVDIYCSVPYGMYIFAALGAGVYLYFKDYRALQRYAWIFFLMNMAAYVTYHVYPAAPPWYYHAHGCEISMTAMPSAGPRLTHVDEVLGITYFRGLYERSSDLYGAVPSLHVAYPLLIVIEGWRSFRLPGRVLGVIFVASMGFAAIYLDHHWVVDVVLGFLYCVGSMALVRFVESRLRGGSQAPAPAPAAGVEA